MKLLYTFLAGAAICALVGCGKESAPGGPGANKPKDDKTTGDKVKAATGVGNADNTFKIDVPRLATDVKQGEKKTVKISISRGKNFDQDVKLEFGKLPMGVTISPASTTLKAGEKEVEIMVEAAKDAALGDHTVTVTATPAREGAATTADFKVEVKKA